MTPEEIEEINSSLWDEIEEIKEASGYNAYLLTRRDEVGYPLHHFTLVGYLRHIRAQAEKA